MRYYLTPVKMDGRRQWHPTPVLLPGKFHGRRSLVGCSPWGIYCAVDWFCLAKFLTSMKTENMVLVLFIRESTMNNIRFFKNLRSFRCCLLFVFLCKRPKPGSQVLNPSSAFQCCVSFCSTTKQISSVYTRILFFMSTPPYPQSHPSRSAQSTELHLWAFSWTSRPNNCINNLQATDHHQSLEFMQITLLTLNRSVRL